MSTNPPAKPTEAAPAPLEKTRPPSEKAADPPLEKTRPPSDKEVQPAAENTQPPLEKTRPPSEKAVPAQNTQPVEKTPPAAAEPSQPPAEKAPPAEKPVEKPVQKPAEKPVEKPVQKPPAAEPTAAPSKPAETKPAPLTEAVNQEEPTPSATKPVAKESPSQASQPSSSMVSPTHGTSQASGSTPTRSSSDNLRLLFKRFCNFGAGQRGAGDQMDNAKFVKFCKDTKLIDGKKFTQTSADLLFSKIKPKGGRTISYDCFKYSGLPDIAGKKGITVQQVIDGMLAAEGPKSSGTVGDAVRFHDDKSQYTGVYKAGGPTNVDLGTSDLSHITNRQSADVRGTNIVVDKRIPQREVPQHKDGRVSPQKMRSSPTKARPTQQQMQKAAIHVGGTGVATGSGPQMAVVPEGQATGSAENSPKNREARYGRRADPTTCPPSPTRRTNSGGRGAGATRTTSGGPGFRGLNASPKNTTAPPATISSTQSTKLMELFESYLMFGGGQHAKSEMDGVRFTKFCKDGNLFDRAFSAIDSDLMFSRIKPKGGRTITFEVFL
eukprot:TRINITY_DN2582_c1_g2_i1.p1 TRINITY_DN2582_c1_g2~~TRINITY_DN2582_c1_g2_i1.p1  ORF type:complete len:567 (+),score=146.55 TRINITY_DN2582_c1_g2_i1:56-1702(+)